MKTTSLSELEQAIHLARTGQKEQAMTLFHQILKQNPNDVQALLWLGGLTPRRRVVQTMPPQPQGGFAIVKGGPYQTNAGLT